MKKLIFTVCALCAGFSVHAQNAWNVKGGLLMTKACDWNVVGSEMGVGMGGFLGAEYDFRLKNDAWSIAPGAEFSYETNGAKSLMLPVAGSSQMKETNVAWQSYYSLSIPVMFNYRHAITDRVGLRAGVGPYMQWQLGGRSEDADGKKWNSFNQWTKAKDRVSVGLRAEIAVETGSHLSYAFSVKYAPRFESSSFANGAYGNLLYFGLGMGYRF